MKCLCCGKEIEQKSESEIKNQWHKKCTKKFFGTETFPEINISKEQLESLATETVTKGLTVTGVQKKLSLHLSQEKDSRLTLVGYPAGYILKPQTEDFEILPELENLSMNLAKIAGIKTVPNALIKINGENAYITKRIDRKFSKNKTEFFAMEDFCQLSERLTEEKYHSSYEQCAKVIKKYSSQSKLDLTELFYRLVFCFLIGNSDMHLKNFSLIESESKSRIFKLSDAYDLLPVNIIMKDDKEEFALTMNRKKAKIKKSDFLSFANYCEINEKIAEKLISKLVNLKEKFITEIENYPIPEAAKSEFLELLESRMNRII